MVYFNGHFTTIMIGISLFSGFILGALCVASIRVKEIRAKSVEEKEILKKLKAEHQEMYNALADIKLVYDRGGMGMQTVLDRAIVAYKKIRGA